MYGVLFTQFIDNDNVGVLLFDSNHKAEFAFRIMNGFDSLSSLDSRLNHILESSDYKETPEIGEEEIDSVIGLEIEGRKRWVTIINPDNIPDIE